MKSKLEKIAGSGFFFRLFGYRQLSDSKVVLGSSEKEPGKSEFPKTEILVGRGLRTCHAFFLHFSLSSEAVTGGGASLHPESIKWLGRTQPLPRLADADR